ncbi:PqiC family protein [Paraburkholderia phenoliruptrix]|uniref:PqiC family protein n=1 Tax=Paraburkholderia phenoliruptrix TaxID=252970 RepID=UPI0028699C11|nr:PqiC family protein [Paraburkholderia phenoliruptrix]WMY10416.1 PqiC family protein [Paraburkholderia phenoliruptrix]
MSAHANHGKAPQLRNSLAALAVFAAWAGLSGLALLSACSSPPSGFYTLVGGVPPSHTRSAAPPMLMIDVATVDVPAQVARTAFVVQADANRVNVLEQTRWASLPADEIRLALSQELAERLDTLDVSRFPRPAGVPIYRVHVSVQRFESWPGSHALIDAVWSVRALSEDAALTCRSVVSESVGAGNDALVAGHRKALQQMSADIAGGIRALDAAARAHRLAPRQAPIPCVAQ